LPFGVSSFSVPLQKWSGRKLIFLLIPNRVFLFQIISIFYNLPLQLQNCENIIHFFVSRPLHNPATPTQRSVLTFKALTFQKIQYLCPDNEIQRSKFATKNWAYILRPIFCNTFTYTFTIKTIILCFSIRWCISWYWYRKMITDYVK